MNEICLLKNDKYQNYNDCKRFINKVMQIVKNNDYSCYHDLSNQMIVIKPNWIQESHEENKEIWEPVITHPVLVISVIECLAELMNGKGTITICDAPHTYANFEAILARGGFKNEFEQLRSKWPDMNFELIDLRKEVWIRKEKVIVKRIKKHGDKRGNIVFNLRNESLFYKYPGEGRYYGADYNTRNVNNHHHDDTHEYLISATPIQCDLFINLPKLKTHKKTGITCSLKNLVGINADKNWLPHYTEGSPEFGGDEFPENAVRSKLESSLKKYFRKNIYQIPGIGPFLYRKARSMGIGFFGNSDETIRNGNWNGNDTCWRMVLDLNRIILYGNPDGSMRDSIHPKKYLTIVDGIVGGEGNGPLCPDSVQSNFLLAGTNPAEVDAVACCLMGLQPDKIPVVREAFKTHKWPITNTSIDAINVYDEREKKIINIHEIKPAVKGGFKPHYGWKNIVEENV